MNCPSSDGGSTNSRDLICYLTYLKERKLYVTSTNSRDLKMTKKRRLLVLHSTPL